MIRYLKFAACSAVVVLAYAFSGLTGPAHALPGDATSLSEVHGNWTLACLRQEDRTRCAIRQIQADPKTRKRVLSFELQLRSGNATGLLVMPFGLALEKGVTLKIDAGDNLPVLKFTTCLPAGCLVPVAADPALLAALKAGSELTVTASANDADVPLTFQISLNGFSAAWSRLVELAE